MANEKTNVRSGKIGSNGASKATKHQSAGAERRGPPKAEIQAAVDSVPLPVAIIAIDRRLHYANDAMVREFDGGLFTVTDGRLGLSVAAPPTSFGAIMTKIADRIRTGHLPEADGFTIGDPRDRHGYVVHVTPMDVSDTFGFDHNIAVLVTARAWTRAGVVDFSQLREAFDLTEPEVQLTFALVESGSLATAARARGLTEGSARQYLKRIFQKTNTTGQVELVSLCIRALLV